MGEVAAAAAERWAPGRTEKGLCDIVFEDVEMEPSSIISTENEPAARERTLQIS